MRNGIRICRPTSVAVTGSGSSASIVGRGSVEFATAATLSLNGVFSSDYDNYMVVIHSNAGTAGNYNYELRLRSAGSDAATSNYTHQALFVSSSTVSAGRGSSQTVMRFGQVDGTTARSGNTVFMYGPNLAQPTALRGVNAGTTSGASIYDLAATHSLSTSYDGFTFFVGSAGITQTGIVAVYGLVD